MKPKTKIKIGDIEIGKGKPLALIAGPCVIETLDHALYMAEEIKKITDSLNIPYIFKSSFDKANRTSIKSFRGPGLEEGLKILESVKQKIGIPITTDFHTPDQASIVGEIVDLVQIPAFLCRQTDMLIEAGKTGKPVNIKKGQFIAPWDIYPAVEKILSTGNNQIAVTERGTTFGYNRLIVDFAGIAYMLKYGLPIIFDGTHSVQLPGGLGNATGGRREMVEPLCLAAVAVGVDAIFLEVHNDPDKAPSDGPNMVPLHDLKALLLKCKKIWESKKNKKEK